MRTILTCPERQQHLVDRLVRYIRQLSGTEVTVIPITRREDDVAKARIKAAGFANNLFPCLQATGLRKAALLYRGEPFIWLEPDSIPLTSDWHTKLVEAYRASGRPYMLSSDSHPPHDPVGGIGIYGPETYWQIPDMFPAHGWDLWMVKHIPQLIYRTPLIQHNYGTWFEGTMRPLRGPAIKNLLRAGAILFHRDRHQELLAGDGYIPTVHHTGEMGDIIAALPILRHIGPVHLTIGNHPLEGWRKMSDGGYKTILPLLRHIPYIKSVTWSDHAPAHSLNMAHFREAYKHDQTLTASQADYIGVPYSAIDMSEWITEDMLFTPKQWAKQAIKPHHYIAIARSERYHNPAFDWPAKVAEVVKAYTQDGKSPAVHFFGTPKEYEAIKYLVPDARHIRTKDFLDLAQRLNFASAFIGNQSGPWWLARSMGIETHQETHDYIRDSIVGGPDAHYF